MKICWNNTETQKYKISKSKAGKNHPMFNRFHLEETKAKISETLKEYYSDPTKCTNWKGGISYEPYCIQWRDKEYKNWMVYERDDGKCQNLQCSKEHNRLCLHHINYIKKDCKPENLVTLCISCNSKANKDREWHEAHYNEIMRKGFEKNGLQIEESVLNLKERELKLKQLSINPPGRSPSENIFLGSFNELIGQINQPRSIGGGGEND